MRASWRGRKHRTVRPDAWCLDAGAKPLRPCIPWNDGRGMNRLRSFFAVTLPQIKSSEVAGGIFAFISAMDETIVALFISGGQYQPLTKRMFTALRDEIARFQKTHPVAL